MGNCFNKPVTWLDDDDDDDDDDVDEPPSTEHYLEKKKVDDDFMSRDMFDIPSITASAGVSSTEIKITISKRQLEELLREVDGSTLQKLLLDLVAGEGGFQEHERHWRPKLQSVPEVAE